MVSVICAVLIKASSYRRLLAIRLYNHLEGPPHGGLHDEGPRIQDRLNDPLGDHLEGLHHDWLEENQDLHF